MTLKPKYTVWQKGIVVLETNDWKEVVKVKGKAVIEIRNMKQRRGR